MTQLEHIEAIEARLWKAADTLRANSNYASNEYFLPVMGLIFLRHAYSRYLSVKEEIEAQLPRRGGKTRALTKEDFSQRGAIYLKPEAQFETLVALPDSADRARAIIDAMESIEQDYATLRGVLPKAEYQELSNDVLGQLLRILNPDELKRVSGDVFGRIYEYFLTQFADEKAHDGGEFFTPVSLVSLIANVLEPETGIVLDPACGSGGMFVQSARFVERREENPTDKLTFYGLEKNTTTIRLAKMNLAVHGLEGDIQRAITYYEDPHELVGRADYVMANPPFNVDEIDADKVKADPRLPFGLPGVNKHGRISNGNYVWISYFYSYLNERGRAGFVMSSQASSAGHGEAKVRQSIVETGDVDIMIAIRSNFFYTRSVPCELWFFNRDKPEEHKDKVLMIDARNVYRQVTRRIYDFSPEQQKNLLAIVWLYRGETDRYVDLLASYCSKTLTAGEACLPHAKGTDEQRDPMGEYLAAIAEFREAIAPFARTLEGSAPVQEGVQQLERARNEFEGKMAAFRLTLEKERATWTEQATNNDELVSAVDRMNDLADFAHRLVKHADGMHRKATRLFEACENELAAREHNAWNRRAMNALLRAADDARRTAVESLKQVRYFHRQARWLTDRFPDGVLRDVPGLVKLVGRDELEANDWSLTPGRYVGVAPPEDDEDFDFEEAMRDIHDELTALNAEAAELAETIHRNFEELVL